MGKQKQRTTTLNNEKRRSNPFKRAARIRSIKARGGLTAFEYAMKLRYGK